MKAAKLTSFTLAGLLALGSALAYAEPADDPRDRRWQRANEERAQRNERRHQREVERRQDRREWRDHERRRDHWERRDDRRDYRSSWHGKHHPSPPRWGHRPPVVHYQPPPVVHYHSAPPVVVYRSSPRWSRGDHLPYNYRAPRYVVHDWQHRRLSSPPRGHHWVNTGGAEYLLVGIATGVILQAVLSN